jgi:hypothetical protein
MVFNRKVNRTTKIGAVLAGAALAGAGVVVSVSSTASANEGIPEGAPLSDFVDRSYPQWNFDRAVGNDVCWPADPIAGGNQHPGSGGGPWPNADKDCPPVNTPFPTFYSVKECNDSEIRASFTIYQPYSGFAPFGHRHDFEYIVMVWTREGETWTRNRLLMSTHGKHRTRNWSEAESWTYDGGHAALGLERPRIFVGWGSHAMFNDQGGLTDIASQGNDNESRHAKYPVWADWRVEVTDDNDVAKTFEKYDWGSATSNPQHVSKNLCSFA